MSRRGRINYGSMAYPYWLSYGSATFSTFFNTTLEPSWSGLYNRHSRGGGGGTQTGGYALQFHLPMSFQRWLTGFTITTRRSGTTTSFLARFYNAAAVLDGAYTGGITIRPTAADVWETFTLPVPTGTYAAGEECLLDLESVLPGNTNHEYRDTNIYYSE